MQLGGNILYFSIYTVGNYFHIWSSRSLYYKSSVDCFMKTVKKEGFWALYKGFFPTWIRMGPWSLTFWLSYEKIRKAMGTKSF